MRLSYAEAFALLQVVIQHGAAQVVGRGHGVNIAGEVQVDVLHGQHLGVSAAGGAAFDAEHRTEEGSRRAMTVRFPILDIASPRPTVVVVLPSPAGGD